MATSRKPASPAIADAARDAERQETETSGLTPDQRTVMKPQETGIHTLAEARWPFPSPSLPDD
jgi:hypothetical protein